MAMKIDRSGDVLFQIEKAVFGYNKFIHRRLEHNPFILTDTSKPKKSAVKEAEKEVDISNHLEHTMALKPKIEAVLWRMVEKEVALMLAVKDVGDSAAASLNCSAELGKVTKAVTSAIEVDGILECMDAVGVSGASRDRILSTILPNINFPDLVSKVYEKLRRV